MPPTFVKGRYKLRKLEIKINDWYKVFIMFIVLNSYGILLEKIKFVGKSSPDISAALNVVYNFIASFILVLFFSTIVNRLTIAKCESLDCKNINMLNIINTLIKLNYTIVSYHDDIVIYNYGAGSKCQGYIKLKDGVLYIHDQGRSINILKKEICLIK